MPGLGFTDITVPKVGPGRYLTMAHIVYAAQRATYLRAKMVDLTASGRMFNGSGT